MFEKDVDITKTYGSSKFVPQYKRGATNAQYRKSRIESAYKGDGMIKPRQQKRIYSLMCQLGKEPRWYKGISRIEATTIIQVLLMELKYKDKS